MREEMKELDALLEHLISHNKNHADEITTLAGKAQALGKTSAYTDLMQGVEAMNTSNESLMRALESLRSE